LKEQRQDPEPPQTKGVFFNNIEAPSYVADFKGFPDSVPRMLLIQNEEHKKIKRKFALRLNTGYWKLAPIFQQLTFPPRT